MRTILVSTLALAACGGGSTMMTGDDVPQIDAPVVANTMITVSGVGSEVGLGGKTPTAGIVVGAYNEGDTTPIVMATTPADGTYSLVIPTHGMPLAGYLKGTKAGDLDTYLYPPAPLAADFSGASVFLLSSGNFGTAQTLAGATQETGMGFVGVLVVDSANMPVQGAVVTTTPAGMVRYSKNGLPTKPANAMSTDTDGTAYVFDVPPGTSVMVSATKSGSTFHAHTVNVRPDVITTTIVQ